MLNPNEIAIYAALTGAALEVDAFALGHGLVLSRTAVHLSTDSVLSLLPSVPEVNQGGLRMLARSGPGLDLAGQLHIPAEFRPQRWLDRVNTVWWIATLLRLRCTPEVRIPLLSSEPFSGEPAGWKGAELWPVEDERRPLAFEPEGEARIREEDLRWIEAHWFHSGRLVVRRPTFNRAIKSLDRAYLITEAPLALVALWESLEALLAPRGAAAEPGLPESVASFLEPPGAARRKLGERIAGLYEARAPAEASVDPPEGSLAETYGIVKRVCLKVIEEERVPTREEIAAGRFVGLN
jgi:hypothetical protein